MQLLANTVNSYNGDSIFDAGTALVAEKSYFSEINQAADFILLVMAPQNAKLVIFVLGTLSSTSCENEQILVMANLPQTAIAKTASIVTLLTDSVAYSLVESREILFEKFFLVLCNLHFQFHHPLFHFIT